MRRPAVILTAVGVLLFGTAGNCTANPDHMTGTVQERSNLDNNLPECEQVGNVCRRVQICLNKNDAGKGTNCLDYPPSEVKNCSVGAEWPKCKTVKR